MNIFIALSVYFAAFIIVWAANGAKLPRWFYKKNEKQPVKRFDIHIEFSKNNKS